MGRPYAPDRQFSAFGELVLAIAEAKGIKIGTLTKVISRSRLYEALRASAAPARRTPKLSYAELSELAAELQADAQETRKLILLGLLQHAPPELASCTVRAIAHTMAQAKRLKSRPPELDFSGEALRLPDELP